MHPSLCALPLLLLLAAAHVASGQGTGGGGGAVPQASVNLTLWHFCNSSLCNATVSAANASASNETNAPTAPSATTAAPADNSTVTSNATTIAFGECVPYSRPAFNCTANTTSDNSTTGAGSGSGSGDSGSNSTQEFRSLWTSSCTNQTANDTITLWFYTEDECNGTAAFLLNALCDTCVEFGNLTLYVNCSELAASLNSSTNGTNATTTSNSRRRQAPASDCPNPNSLTSAPSESPAPATGAATTGQTTSSPAPSSPAYTSPSPASAGSASPTMTTGRQQNSGCVESTAAAGLLVSFAAIWLAL